MEPFELGRLTYRDFEAVCCDLLGQILGVPLEIFAPGADRGIDLRYAGPETDGPLIVQCKHWKRSGRTTLIRHMEREELPKIRRLNPGRYILATSAELSLSAKERLLEILRPYVRSPGDIYGCDDIVRELRGRPELVERHFRLWLTGTAVLQTVLNQDIFLRSDWLRDELTRCVETFVPHEGFSRAFELLKTRSTCIISGSPGVGKTTVATMLAVLLAADGYQVIEVSENIREATAVWRDGVRQAFVYDDFLGRTTLEPHLAKNEDGRLMSFIRQVQGTPGKALIMTTRDYILQHARQHHDRLADQDIETSMSVVEFSDLTLEVRAAILHNHVYHAAIPVQEKRAFADRRAWEPIVGHRNFSPRIIEETLRLRRGTSDGIAVDEVRHNLDDPQRIWERIVENDLDDAAVHILEVLFASGPASHDELQEDWSRYRRELDLPAHPRAFRQAIRILEGTMLRADRDRLALHNPSIEDYLRRHMNLGRTDVRALLRSLRTAGDVTHFLYTVTGHGSDGLLEQFKGMPGEVATALRAVEDTIEISVSEEDDSIQLHLAWVLEVGQKLGSPKLAEYVESRVEDLGVHVHDGHTPHVAILANALRTDPWVSQAIADRLDRQLAEDVLGYIEEGVEAGNWAWAIKARRSLPEGFSFVPSEEFCQLALDELHILKDEKYSLAGWSCGWDEDTADLLDFLDSQFPPSERPAEYEQVKLRFQALQESIRQAEANRPASYPGSVSWSEAIRVGPDTWRRIGLLMDGLRHLQCLPQE